METQTNDILQHLKDGRRLTQKEAINNYGAYRLSGIIYRLRQQGYEIDSIPIEVPTRYKKQNGETKMAQIGYTECYTCGKIDHYKKMQCGHFLSRRYHTTRWNTTNCQVQCVKCNMYEQGEQYKFGTKLSMEFGVEEVEYLTNLANTTMKRTRGEYKEDISYYQNLVKNLKKTKGID